MTDRHAGFLVMLAADIRSDDGEAIAAALRMIKGVSKVVPVPADPASFITSMRRDDLWRGALGQLAAGGPDPEGPS